MALNIWGCCVTDLWVSSLACPVEVERWPPGAGPTVMDLPSTGTLEVALEVAPEEAMVVALVVALPCPVAISTRIRSCLPTAAAVL